MYDLDLFVKPGHLDPAPKPFPERRWDAMPGLKVTPDLLREMKPDDLHRDMWSIDKRIEMWEEVEKLHQDARSNNAGIPPETGLYLVSGKMGAGKSLYMASVALNLWAYRAVPVFSPDSSGLCFGYRISLAEMYQFSDILPPGSCLVSDELAALSDNYGGSALRNRTLSSTLTSFRKGGSLLLGASAAEWLINPNLRVACEAMITPRRIWPSKAVQVWDELGEHKVAHVRMREGELQYPKWAYMALDGLMLPYERRRLWEDYEAALYKVKLQRRKKVPAHQVDLARFRPISVKPPTPRWAYCTSALYDTFSRVPVTDQHHITADRVREASISQPTGPQASTATAFASQVEAYLRWVINTSLVDECASRDGWCDFERLRDVAGQFNASFRGCPMTKFKKAVTALAPDACTARRVSLRDLQDVFGRGHVRGG